MSTTCALHDSSDPDWPQKSDVEAIPLRGVHDESQFSPRLRVDLVIDPIPLGNRQRITNRKISNLLAYPRSNTLADLDPLDRL
jgi:hypothetical protein